jgi:hypothetical protein
MYLAAPSIVVVSSPKLFHPPPSLLLLSFFSYAGFNALYLQAFQVCSIKQYKKKNAAKTTEAP